jgi:hypothetical protein
MKPLKRNRFGTLLHSRIAASLPARSRDVHADPIATRSPSRRCRRRIRLRRRPSRPRSTSPSNPKLVPYSSAPHVRRKRKAQSACKKDCTICLQQRKEAYFRSTLRAQALCGVSPFCLARTVPRFNAELCLTAILWSQRQGSGGLLGRRWAGNNPSPRHLRAIFLLRKQAWLRSGVRSRFSRAYNERTFQ